MIQANELRIGNLILELGWDEDSGGNIVGDSDSNEFVRVDIDLLSEIAKPTPGRITQYEGIPLTPEILEKAGFKKEYNESNVGETVEETKFLESFGGTRTYFNGWTNGKLSIDRNMFYSLIKIKSVHQLQNLYFALTGEELNINL